MSKSIVALVLGLVGSAKGSPRQEHSVIFDLNHRPLHMSDVVLSLLNGTHREDKRTEQLKPEESLSKLQLSTPCGWFWHSPGSVQLEKHSDSTSAFLDRGATASPTAFAMPLTIVQYEDPIELQKHKVFGSQVPAFNSLDSLTPHAWNFVKALNGDPNAVSLESAAFPGYYVHHYLSPSAAVAARSYQVMMSHQKHISDPSDATWRIGNAFGNYNIPVMVAFKTVNIPQEHHIVHICVEDESGELQCNLKIAPRKDIASAQAALQAAAKAKMKMKAAAKVVKEKVVEKESDSENFVQQAVHLLEGVLPTFATAGFEHREAEAPTPEDAEGASAQGPGFAVAAENEAEVQQSIGEDVDDAPEVKDFDNAAAFYVHNV
jgi:hypothetical protein